MRYIRKFNESEIYDSSNRHKALKFAEENWPIEVIDRLLETNIDIVSILSEINDFGDYTIEEWVDFFKRLRKEGI